MQREPEVLHSPVKKFRDSARTESGVRRQKLQIRGSGLHAGARGWVTECSPGGRTDGPAEPQRSLGGGYSQAITVSQRFDLRKRDQLRNMVLSQGRHSPIESMSILS